MATKLRVSFNPKSNKADKSDHPPRAYPRACAHMSVPTLATSAAHPSRARA